MAGDPSTQSGGVLSEPGMAVEVLNENDIVTARQRGRIMAEEAGFSGSDLTLIAIVISELARNIVDYAGRGEIVLSVASNGSRRGLTIVARDQGGGIVDTELAMRDGYSTGGGLGLGLPGVRRLTDIFALKSAPGEGTTVEVTKWAR
jgi:serine/threonine-protein kinase RsbT